MSRLRLVLVMGALALGVSACGDDDTMGVDAGPIDSGTDAAMSDDTGPAPDAPPMMTNTIVDVAVAAGFSSLVGAVQAAGLEDTLRGPGPFTVFAPTNEAFAALGEAPTGDALAQVLQYHVLAGAVRSTDLDEGVQLPTSVNDLSLVVTRDGATVTLNSGVQVTMANIEADNGVIHVIDAVLIPPTIAAMAGHAGLTTLASALPEDVAALLSGDGTFTVFAPTNDAFDDLDAVPTGDALLQVLQYHVIAGAAVASADVPARADSAAPAPWFTGEDAPTMTLLFDTTDGVRINGSASVAIADVRCTNGIVHVIDAVLLPMNIPGIATAAGFTGLLGAVGAAADIGETPVATALSGDGPLTVFAPGNAAFEDIAATVETLTPEQVRDVLLLHVIGSGVRSTDLPDVPAAGAETLLGPNVTFDLSEDPPTVSGPENSADIVGTDIIGTNGVVHVIDTVLLPTL